MTTAPATTPTPPGTDQPGAGGPPVDQPTGDPQPGALAPSLADRVHDELREAIVSGEMPQGTRLPEARLSSRMNVSRVPLREALPRLVAQGLVTTGPRRGAVVRTWTGRDVEDLFDVRLALEVAAAGHAALRVADGACAEALTAAVATSEETLVTGDDLAVARASVGVHEAVVRLSGNEIMVATMATVSARVLWLFHLTAGRDQRQACAEHRDLADAIGSGDAVAARSLMAAHVESGRAPTLLALGLAR